MNPPSASCVAPASLLSPNRFDIVAKYLYAKWRLRGLAMEWPRRLYLAHIDVFNGFVEPDGSGKCGEARFIEDFNKLIDEISAQGFDVELSRIPLAASGEIVNGAHRLAACLAAERDVGIEPAPLQTAYVYDHRWFQRRGLAQRWTDAIALEACRLLPRAFVIVVYPSALGLNDELEELIAGRTRVWYRKHIALSENGAVNLVQQIYRHEHWLGGPNNDFRGARDKKSWCFRHPGPVRTWLVDSTLETIKALKSEIRAMYGIENHSVHINDTHDEARELASLLFNDNSVDFLNRRRRVALPWFDALRASYAKSLARAGLEHDNCCIDGSGVLAAYGIRDVRDLDFLHDPGLLVPEFGAPQIASHNADARWYPASPETIVHDPHCHFQMDGLKFASLTLVREMKLARDEIKDRADVDLIDRWHDDSAIQASLGARVCAALSWRRLYQQARFVKLKLRLWRHWMLRGRSL